MPAPKSKTFRIFLSYSNVYIEAKGAAMSEQEIAAWGKKNKGASVDVGAKHAVVVFHPYAHEQTMSVTAEIHDTKPQLSKGHWDHIVEAPLKIDNGIIQIWDGFPPFRAKEGAQFKVPQGTYRARIHFGNLSGEDTGRGAGGARYLILIWPAPIKDLAVIKQWPPFLKPAKAKPDPEDYVKEANAVPAKIAPRKFPVSQTIELGTYASVDELVAALAKKKIRIAGGAMELLKQTTLEPRKTKIDLIKITPKDLGFTTDILKDRYISMRKFYEAAKKAGYDLAPAEAGPQLRLQADLSHARGFIAMKPLMKKDGSWGVFDSYDTPTGKWLLAQEANPYTIVNEDLPLLFVRARGKS